MIPSTLRKLAVPIASLKPYPRNARRGNVEAVKESLTYHGQYRPIVVRAHTNEVLAGNHTLAAAKELGWQEIAATFVDVDDDEAARINLVDNRANDLAGYDDGALAELLASLPKLDGTGYGQEDLDALLAKVQGPRAGLTDPDDVPEAPAEPVTKPGDLWLLGEHHLLCGDSTVEAEVGRLMAGAKAYMLWTDPPYGVSYVGKTKDALTLQNDQEEGLEQLLTRAFANATEALIPGAAFYIAHPPGGLSLTFGAIAVAAGWRVHQTLVWVKDSMVLGHTDYHYQHEPILYGWTPGPGRSGRGHHDGTRWYGDHSQTSVFEVDRPKRSTEHPTAKPVDLIRPHLRNSSRPGEVALDLFAGSGSTLIAAHQERRLAYLMEIDPCYVDVTCRRFQEFTGILPILEATGEEHDFVQTASDSAER